MEPTSLLSTINVQQSTNLTLDAPFAGGEQGAYAISDERGAQYALKFTPGDDAFARFQAARDITERLRTCGYPAPQYRYVGSVDGVAYSVQEALLGRPMGRLDATHLPRLLELNDLQAGAASNPAEDWPASIIESVAHGFEGYCVIDSLRTYSTETRALLERLQLLVAASAELTCPTDDIVHFDFNPANILVADDTVSGVIDWDGAQAGERSFDLATLLFYAADQADVANALWQAAVERSSAAAIRLYLAHLIVRQVDWSIRNHADDVAQYWLIHSLAVDDRYLSVTNQRSPLL